MVFTVHYHDSNSYYKVQHFLAKIWYGHGPTGRSASDGLEDSILFHSN